MLLLVSGAGTAFRLSCAWQLGFRPQFLRWSCTSRAVLKEEEHSYLCCEELLALASYVSFLDPSMVETPSLVFHGGKSSFTMGSFIALLVLFLLLAAL